MIRMSNHVKVLATTAAAIALAVPAAASADVDLRNPDNRVSEQQTQVDLRNPDSREPSQPTDARHRGYVDLRSPDSREPSRPVETPTIATPAGDDGAGFSWGDAAIGAGIAFALLLIGLSGLMAVYRRRGHGATA
jgi:hypothetical protein